MSDYVFKDWVLPLGKRQFEDEVEVTLAATVSALDPHRAAQGRLESALPKQG